MRKEALLAAKYSLAKPLIPSWFEIGLISASDLLSLLSYHQGCGDAVYALRLSLSWIPAHFRTKCYWLSDQFSINELDLSLCKII